MSDECFNLLPSLWRLSKFDDATEHDLITDFLTLRPEAFSNLSSSFDVLSKMQHYGLPTRLLDFTLNPLVALYFACEQLPDKNGRVICHFATISSLENSIINTICSIPMNPYYPFSEDYPIEYFVPTSIPFVKYLSRTIRASERPIIAKPLYWNQRIINQSAVFMIYQIMFRLLRLRM